MCIASGRYSTMHCRVLLVSCLQACFAQVVVQEQGFFNASDCADIGYIVSHIPPNRGLKVKQGYQNRTHEETVILFAPGYSGTAIGFTQWFAPTLLLAEGVTELVIMDWRGFGSSVGPWGPAAPPDGPDAPSYGGLSTWRLAEDLYELGGHLGLLGSSKKKCVLMGHSMGVNVVLQLLDLHGLSFASGLVLLDDSPRNMNFAGMSADSDFPSDAVTFTVDRLKAWMPQYLAYDGRIQVAENISSMSLAELADGSWQPYFKLEKTLFDQFHSADESDPVHGKHFMTQTSAGLLAWMQFLGASNGKVTATTMVSSMEQDLTGVAAKVRAAKVPFFWYGGEESLLPISAIEWSANAMSPCSKESAEVVNLSHGSLTSFCPESGSGPAYQFLRFSGSAGNHCPWLNADESAKLFMDSLSNFVSRV
jgi:pimeloyl-ACP methyl ester carboxylesterase